MSNQNNQQNQEQKTQQPDPRIQRMITHLKRISLFAKQEADEVLSLIAEAGNDETKQILVTIQTLMINAKYKTLREQEKEMCQHDLELSKSN